jgi:hypothetical protein
MMARMENGMFPNTQLDAGLHLCRLCGRSEGQSLQ